MLESEPNSNNLTIVTPNRPYGLQIADFGLESDWKFAKGSRDILRGVADGKFYYEGLDHSEFVPMIEDFMEATGVGGGKIVVVNLDTHSDIASSDIKDNGFNPSLVKLSTWLRSVDHYHYLNESEGVFWVYNTPVELSSGNNGNVIKRYENKGINVRKAHISSLIQRKDQGVMIG